MTLETNVFPLRWSWGCVSTSKLIKKNFTNPVFCMHHMQLFCKSRNFWGNSGTSWANFCSVPFWLSMLHTTLDGDDQKIKVVCFDDTRTFMLKTFSSDASICSSKLIITFVSEFWFGLSLHPFLSSRRERHGDELQFLNWPHLIMGLCHPLWPCHFLASTLGQHLDRSTYQRINESTVLLSG